MALDSTVQQRFDACVTRGELSLPLLPEVATQVLAMADRPTVDARQLADLLRRDPSLTAHVMHLAASPMYAGATKLVSLQQVIGRLGLATITQLALAVATRMRVFAVAGFEPEVRATFRHSLASALFAQEIARARRSVVDLAFLAGLLHDIGKPLALQVLVDLHAELAIVPDRAAVLAEAERVHAELGGTLIASWSLAPRIADAVRAHHAPAGDELALTVALGDRFAHALAGDAFAGDELAGALNLYPEDVARLAARGADIGTSIEVFA